MTVATMKTNTWGFTCKLCKVLQTALVTFTMGAWAFGESMGRARAAAELHRLGYTEEAKRLMLENK
ncbi:hypothetical protein N8072_01380 [bacterium]|nr:hypothetical protein [bacterium]MDB4128495.1 hypothetical protein [bacterium]MDC1257305.1 hypothetical protein [bacterium]